MNKLKFLMSAALLSMAVQPAYAERGRPSEGGGGHSGEGGGHHDPRPNPGHGGGDHDPRPNPGHGGGRPDPRPHPRPEPRPEPRPNPIPYPRPNPGHGHDPRRGNSNDCSPEVKTKSVNAVEARVGSMLKTSEFNSASDLKSTFASIRSERNLETKIARYCDLVGVDSSNASEVASFVGARDFSRYSVYAQRKLDLTTEQANDLVREISQTLLNGINR